MLQTNLKIQSRVAVLEDDLLHGSPQRRVLRQAKGGSEECHTSKERRQEEKRNGRIGDKVR